MFIGILVFGISLWAVPNLPAYFEPIRPTFLASASFAPFRDGQHPALERFPSAAQIIEDLEQLRGRVAAVRTYSSLDGMEIVPLHARRLGLTVTMGAWLSWDWERNEREIASLIRLAHTYPDVIKRLIVGNETLLRREMTPFQAIHYLKRVRSMTSVPVSYADVPEFLLKAPGIENNMDFLTVHILPYWENVPQDPRNIRPHLVKVYEEMRAAFPSLPIFIGEIGWPTAGRQRGPAAPSRVNAARFLAEVVNTAHDYGFDYNLIEAFDQNWKIQLEGTVGGRWGLADAQRDAKFDISEGIVQEIPEWPILALLSLTIGLLLWRWFQWQFPASSLTAWTVAGVMTQLWGAMAVFALAVTLSLNYYLADQILGLTLIFLQFGFFFAYFVSMAHLDNRRENTVRMRFAQGFLLLLLVIALIWTNLLLFDGRYRDFPLAEFLLPSFGLWLFGLYSLIFRGVLALPQPSLLIGRRISELLALLLITSGWSLLIFEGGENQQAMLWTGIIMLLSLLLRCDSTSQQQTA